MKEKATTMMWFWAALAAAVFWGFSYASTEPMLKSGISSFALTAFYTWLAAPLFTFLAWRNGTLEHSMAIIRHNPKSAVLLMAMACCIFGGNALIFWAISQRNATSVSLIEISYPLFTALFTWAIFGQNQMTPTTLAGAALIFTGIAVMYVWR